MTSSKTKNLTSKNLPKISEQGTILLNVTPSSAWFEGVTVTPWPAASVDVWMSLFERVLSASVAILVAANVLTLSKSSWLYLSLKFLPALLAKGKNP